MTQDETIGRHQSPIIMLKMWATVTERRAAVVGVGSFDEWPPVGGAATSIGAAPELLPRDRRAQLLRL
jgi:hypothetical protein